MGACASVPKGMRGNSAAPAPEQPKEETHTVKEVKVEDESTRGQKVEEVTEENKVDDEKSTTQSLGNLLVEDEAPKEAGKEAEAPTTVESKESTAAAEPAAPVTSEPAVAAEAVAVKEEKKTEVAEEKK